MRSSRVVNSSFTVGFNRRRECREVPSQFKLRIAKEVNGKWCFGVDDDGRVSSFVAVCSVDVWFRKNRLVRAFPKVIGYGWTKQSISASGKL